MCKQISASIPTTGEPSRMEKYIMLLGNNYSFLYGSKSMGEGYIPNGLLAHYLPNTEVVLGSHPKELTSDVPPDRGL